MIERDNSRIEMLVEVEQKPCSRLVSFYESKKIKLLEDATIKNESSRVFAGCWCLLWLHPDKTTVFPNIA
jgi:hypothetical protein